MSQAKQTYTYLAFMPDYTDEDAFNRRLAVRPKHLENSKLVRERGILSTILFRRLAQRLTVR